MFIWLSSIERVRRSHYLRFIQFHQLHYVFFGFAATHWGTRSMAKCKFPWAVPELGSCASSARAWRLYAAHHSQGGRPGTAAT